eukprot:92578_1
MLFVPSVPRTHERIRKGPSAWMLIDREWISQDGRTCSKIGASYPAHKHETDKCNKRVASCLNNQPEDFHKKGRNFLDSFGIADVPYTDNNSQVFLQFSSDESKKSAVTLTLVADEVQFALNRANGRIVNTTVESFEALAELGQLTVLVE